MDIPAEIEKLSLQSGDLIIIRCPDENMGDVRDALEDMPRDMLNPNILFWVLPLGATAEVIEPDEKEKLRRFLDD